MFNFKKSNSPQPKLTDLTAPGTFFAVTERNSTREGFGIGLKEAAEKNANIIGLCADLAESTRMNFFKDAFPDRYIEVGVAEQNLVGVAAGFALAGKVSVAASYAAFSPYNSYGALRTSVCLQNLNVKIMGGHAGLGIGEDGAAAQALEDIALTRLLPNMTVVVPCDQEEARKATIALTKQFGPCYLRTTKFETRPITTSQTPFEIGKAVTLRDGKDVAIIACGPMVEQALLAADTLETEGIAVTVINMHSIKPLDTECLNRVAQQVKTIITVEDHQIYGGLGSAVAEYLLQSGFRGNFKIMGVQDFFGESGKSYELYEKHGLTASQIIENVQIMIK